MVAAPAPTTPSTSDLVSPSAESGERPEDPAEARGATNDEVTRVEKIMSVTETSSKVHEPATYEEAISDPIHARQWKKAIEEEIQNLEDPIHARQWKKAVEEEIQNLEDHQTWEYDHLPSDRKAVGSKWVFKVKYAPDGSIARYKARLVA